MEAPIGAVESLLRTPPFQDTSRQQLEELVPSLRFFRYDAGDIVWRAGDGASDLCFVLEGQVQAVETSEHGAQVIHDVVGAGESFGHPALFAPSAKRVVTVIALVPTMLARLPKEPLLVFLETHPAAMRRMLESMSLLLLSFSSQVTGLAFHSVRARVALQLIQLADQYGQPVDGGGLRIPFRLSQTTWAGLVATTRESVNRTLSDFAAAGDISQRGGYITVHHRDRLRGMLAGR